MRILALERAIAGKTDSECAPWLHAEALKAWELYTQGVIRELYFRPDTHQAVLLLECEDLHEARTVLASLPLVDHNLITFEIIPLSPYTGFERLHVHASNETGGMH